ncbi:GH32 C-terminal domain-containing protein [Sphingomonas sp. Leaf10]|uniref:GH32 C-terminal domain-containing protein n=1 Tax=Sphingomonas sp. Leaf10 TaxID=1735676 RepID=UPI00138F87FA|nr:GH32 C-terminal domain-containing protein [Sphingomonas sp. Leaf10]
MSAPLPLSAERGFTFDAWMVLESYPSGDEKPVDEQIPASIAQQASKGRGFDLFIDPFGRWGMKVATDNGMVEVVAPSRFPLYGWTRVSASYDPASGQASLYLDGREIARSPGRRPARFRPANTVFQIAHSFRAAPLLVFNINGLNAAYDEVRVFDDAVAIDAGPARRGPLPSAAESLRVPTSRFASDLQRPSYHAMPQANWTNEPHGLVRRGDTWHMFYQRTPNGPFKTMMAWGHLKSDDLVHWTDLPIALYPELQTPTFGFDMKGIWSGDVVNGPGGLGLAFYTSVNYSPNLFNPGISMAISEDPDLIRWKKVGPLLDRTGVADFRDPYVWFEGTTAHMIVGAALGGSGGLAYYRCDNLADRACWKRQPAFAPFAKMDVGSDIWEMPVFEKIAADRYILVANPIGGAVGKYTTPATRGVYWVGTWNGKTFRPLDPKPRVLDVLPGHLSPTIERDKDGRITAVGIVDERRAPQAQLRAGWAHTFSLPRLWRLLPDGRTLGQSPVPALAALRDPATAIATRVSGAGDVAVGDLGRAVEIDATFEGPSPAGRFGLTIARSADGREATRILYDPATREIVLDKRQSTLGGDQEGPQLLRGAYDVAAFGEPRRFHVFVDHSVVDVFVNDAAAFSFRTYPSLADASRFGVTATAPVTAQVKAWRMNAAPIR